MFQIQRMVPADMAHCRAKGWFAGTQKMHMYFCFLLDHRFMAPCLAA